MMTTRYILAALGAAATLGTSASTPDSWEQWGPTHNNNSIEYKVRLGYTIGGTMPLPIPAEMRRINEFAPKGGVTLGADFTYMCSRRWGINTGLHFFYEGFHTSADVKGYQMSITMDDNFMSGYFTGTDVTDMTHLGMTVPVQATCRLSPRWNLSLGPYVTAFFNSTFSGEVYDTKDGVGYLRVDTPTGERVTIDHETPATYEFDENMRKWGAGVELTADWKATSRLNVFGLLDWGLANGVDPDFEAVAFPMYPIYGTVGLAYRF